MATQLFLTSTVADTHLATNNLNGLSGAGTAVGWTSRALSTTRGGGVVASDNTATQTATLHPILIGGVAAEWISPPVAADVTISGTITYNVWASESNMSANVVLTAGVDVIRANALGTQNSNTVVEIAGGFAIGAEVAVTTRAVRNVTDTPGSTVVNRGDRLRIRILDSGGATTGYTWNIGYNGTSAAADGDTYVTFTENFSFESAPAGSVLYLLDTISDVVVGTNELEAWTTRGNSAPPGLQLPTTTVAGWTAPIQLGTNYEWYSEQLTAFTLTGMAVANLWALEVSSASNASLRCEIARVNSDGTSATVWASWCIAPTGTDNGELPTAAAARTANVSGDDLAFTDGQRIRIRVYAEDISSAAMATAGTVRLYFDGNTSTSQGDSYVTLAQTVTEYGGGGPFTYTKAGYGKESA